jgi:hypothetical protein
MIAINRTYNQSWSTINFNGYRGCALMSDKFFAVKPEKSEVEYVVQDLGEW